MDVGFTVDGKANANKYYLSNYERIKHYPNKHQSINQRAGGLLPCYPKVSGVDRMGWICVRLRVENSGFSPYK